MPIPANDPLKHFHRSSAVLPRVPRSANNDKRPGRSSASTTCRWGRLGVPGLRVPQPDEMAAGIKEMLVHVRTITP